MPDQASNIDPSKENWFLSSKTIFPRPIKKFLFAAANLSRILPIYSKITNMREEIAMLTSYSSDTVYRLRYNSMTYEYVSPAIVKLLGFSPEEMKKINFRSLILETKLVNSGMQKINSFEELEKSRRLGNVDKWQADYLMRTKDGRKIWVTDISFPWFNERGVIIGSVGSLRDVTERVSAEEKAQNEMLEIAHRDRLTGIPNRQAFFSSLENELKRFKRSQRHFSILLVDIDYLKKINDELGYDAGDKVLVEISQLITSCLRDTDLLARLDGKEFGIFLPDTTEDGAYWVAERVCKEVSRHCFFVGNNAMPVHTTVSIGVGSTKGFVSAAIADIYKQADTRLYIAKHTGRNQVSVDEIVHMH